MGGDSPSTDALVIAALVATYAVFVSLIPIYAKRIFDGHLGVEKFPYPVAVAGLQVGAACALLGTGHTCWYLVFGPRAEGGSWLLGRHLRYKLRCTSPAGVAFGLKYAVTNWGLDLVSTPTHLLLGATDIVWVLAFATLLNGERPGALQLLGASICLAGSVLVALQSLQSVHETFWPLLVNLLGPFIGALCTSTLRSGILSLSDPRNCLRGTTTKVEFTALKLAVAAATALLTSVLMEGLHPMGSKHRAPWWEAVGRYPPEGVALILASGLLTVVLHVDLAWLAHLTSATTVGIVSEVKVLPQWLLNAAFSLKVDLTPFSIAGALLGMLGSVVYASGSCLAGARGRHTESLHASAELHTSSGEMGLSLQEARSPLEQPEQEST